MASDAAHPSFAPPRRHLLKQALLAAGIVGFGRPVFAAETDAGRLLPALLLRNHGRSPEYHDGLSNHLSMGLRSLAALGGSPDRLRGFFDAQWARLEPLPKGDGSVVTHENWKTWFGHRAALPAYQRFFEAEIASTGREATLRRYLPDLLPGIGAAAFHALIRTGYGARFGDDHEVEDGLAYWAISYLPLGPLGSGGGEQDPLAVLARVHERPELAGRKLAGHLIGGRMSTAARLPEFAAAVASLAPERTTLPAIAAATLRLFVATDDFTALHGMTGTHAYRQLEPFVDPRAGGVRYLWQAVVAAYVTMGAPAVRPPSGAGARWDASLAKARASNDEHDLKLVEIARDEALHYHDPLYERAASRRLALG